MLSACAQKSIEGSLKADESQLLNESSFIELFKYVDGSEVLYLQHLNKYEVFNLDKAKVRVLLTLHLRLCQLLWD